MFSPSFEGRVETHIRVWATKGACSLVMQGGAVGNMANSERDAATICASAIISVA